MTLIVQAISDADRGVVAPVAVEIHPVAAVAAVVTKIEKIAI